LCCVMLYCVVLCCVVLCCVVLCCGKGKDRWKKTCIPMIAFDIQTNKQTFSIVRLKRNNHDFMVYLAKCANASLLLRLKRIALQWN